MRCPWISAALAGKADLMAAQGIVTEPADAAPVSNEIMPLPYLFSLTRKVPHFC